MKKIFFCALATLALTACFSAPRGYEGWYRSDMNEQQTKQILAQCKYNSNTQTHENSNREETIQACMEMQGFDKIR